MELDEQKIDDAVLALLFLSLHDDQRAWKSMDWDAMDRLYQHEFIHDPASKAKSVVLTDSGVAHARRLCEQLFAKPKRQTVRVRYGGAVADAEVADGMAGVLHRDIDGKYFFRVTAAATEFVDYDLRHDDLAVVIAPDAMATLYRSVHAQVLDHSPAVLGLTHEGAIPDVGA